MLIAQARLWRTRLRDLTAHYLLSTCLDRQVRRPRIISDGGTYLVCRSRWVRSGASAPSVMAGAVGGSLPTTGAVSLDSGGAAGAAGLLRSAAVPADLSVFSPVQSDWLEAALPPLFPPPPVGRWWRLLIWYMGLSTRTSLLLMLLLLSRLMMTIYRIPPQ